MTIKERITDWWNGIVDRLDLDRTSLAHILMAVGISCLLLGLCLGIPLGLATRDIGSQGQRIDDSIDAAQVQQLSFQESVNITLQQKIDALWDDIANHLGNFDHRIDGMEIGLSHIQAELSALNETDFAYVAGSWGNYALCVKSPHPGQYTADIHLSYIPGVGNATDYVTALNGFYLGINWTAGEIPAYQCTASCNNTSWSIVDASFNLGPFMLQADVAIVKPFNCPGLNVTWKPAYIYAEIYQLG